MKRFNLNASIRVKQSATATFAAWDSVRGAGRAIAGVLSMFALLMPLAVIPGLILLVLPAEIYLFDWVYSEFKGSKNKEITRSKFIDNTGASSHIEAEKERVVTRRIYPPFAA